MTTATMDRTITRPDVRTSFSEGDHDRFSHWVDKEKIAEAELLERPIKALCGKVWVPKSNPEAYPICPTCAEIKAQLKS